METFRFSPEVTAPAAARRFVTGVLNRWGYATLVELAELLVSEVVTNSVRHAQSSGTLVIRRKAGHVRFETTDSGEGTPNVHQPTPDEPSGRGLAIVSRVADRWGVERAGVTGHTVWFELDVT
jgi:anti-sigma regulatory factor (Ser/Thr protein kinase)